MTAAGLSTDLDDVVRAIRANRYSWANEGQLQTALAQALAAAGLDADREVRLTARDRIDLLVGRIGVEVKIDGTAEAAARQIQRYAASDRVDALVLVTTRSRHRGLPQSLGGKPLAVVVVSAGLA